MNSCLFMKSGNWSVPSQLRNPCISDSLLSDQSLDQDHQNQHRKNIPEIDLRPVRPRHLKSRSLVCLREILIISPSPLAHAE